MGVSLRTTKIVALALERSGLGLKDHKLGLDLDTLAFSQSLVTNVHCLVKLKVC